jgi:hypothetical protein
MPAGVGSSDHRLVRQGQVVTVIYVRRLCSQARRSVITGTNIPVIMSAGGMKPRGCVGVVGAIVGALAHCIS